MSQPHNLQPEDLQLDALQPAAPLTAVPTRTTDRTGARAAQEHPAPTHPDATEAPMAAPNPTSPSTTHPRTSPATGTAEPTAGTSSAATEAAVMEMLAAVARPRLASVGGGLGGHGVPATARYAGELTDGALALRLQAITRLGVVSAPRHLSSIDALATPQPHPTPEEQDSGSTATPQEEQDRATSALAQQEHGGAVVASAPDEESSPAAAVQGERGGASRAEVAGGEVAKEGRKLSVVPAVAGATHSVAAPGHPDGAQAPLKTTDTTSKTTRAAGAGVGGRDPRAGAAPVLPEVRVWGARLAQAVSEVLAGDRPISQLVRFTDDVVFMELNRRVRMLGMNSTAGTRGAKEKSTVRSVRVFMPEPCIAEVAAHVRHGQRSRAVAFRLEVRRNRWVCTALELG